jgi:hypothetical protein
MAKPSSEKQCAFHANISDMDIVYLDQNKWIELARVHAGHVTAGPIVAVYAQLSKAVESGQVLLPLSISHILETSKRNDLVSRGCVAATQARLSRGYVYRSRTARLKIEIQTVLRRLFGEQQPQLPGDWVLARGFLQAFEPMDELIVSPQELERIRRINTALDPAATYVAYMKDQDDQTRRSANANLTAGVVRLLEQIEARRALVVGKSVDLRRRAYSARLFLDHQDMILDIAKDLGYSFEQLEALGSRAVTSLIEDVPTLNVEAEMASRLEAEGRRIDPHDVFDMQSFYTAIPYSSRVIAEKASVSRAKQAALDRRYSVLLSPRLTDLAGVYQ